MKAVTSGSFYFSVVLSCFFSVSFLMLFTDLLTSDVILIKLCVYFLKQKIS